MKKYIWWSWYKIVIVCLCFIFLWIILFKTYSTVNIKDEFCETFSWCPYVTHDPERKHHFVAYYDSPLFFEKNIVIVWSNQFESYNRSSDPEYVWWKVFWSTISQDKIDEISILSTFMIEVPFSSDKTMKWWVDVCRYGERWCKKEWLYQSPQWKDDIVQYDACMIILAQDEGSEIVEVLKKEDKNCYVIDIREKSWNKIALWFENS